MGYFPFIGCLYNFGTSIRDRTAFCKVLFAALLINDINI